MSDLFTKRLRIEPLRADHAPRVIDSLQDVSIYTYLPNDPPTLEFLQRRYNFLENGRSPDGKALWLNWLVFCRQTDVVIGTFQATLPESASGAIAYVIFPSFWRQGYAREMTLFMMNYLFDTYEPPSLYAEIDTRNRGSIRLVEGLGFTQVSIKRNADFFKGASSDEFMYSISRTDWAVLSNH